MLRRYRWRLVGGAAGACAVGFLLTLAALAPVRGPRCTSAGGFRLSMAALAPGPGAPGQAADAAPPAGADAPCSDYSGTSVGVHAGRAAVFEAAPGGRRPLLETHPTSVHELPAYQ